MFYCEVFTRVAFRFGGLGGYFGCDWRTEIAAYSACTVLRENDSRYGHDSNCLFAARDNFIQSASLYCFELLDTAFAISRSPPPTSRVAVCFEAAS